MKNALELFRDGWNTQQIAKALGMKTEAEAYNEYSRLREEERRSILNRARTEDEKQRAREYNARYYQQVLKDKRRSNAAPIAYAGHEPGSRGW